MGRCEVKPGGTLGVYLEESLGPSFLLAFLLFMKVSSFATHSLILPSWYPEDQRPQITGQLELGIEHPKQWAKISLFSKVSLRHFIIVK